MFKLSRKGMFNKKPAEKWDEAYPSGNGIQGVLVMGEPIYETVIFNHERLFLPLPENASSEIPDMSDEIEALRGMIWQGRYGEATGFYLRKLHEKGFPSDLIWTDPFHPAFDLRIRTQKAGEPADYLRWLDFETGEAGVSWTDDRGTVERRLFVSRKCNAVIIKINAPAGKKLDCVVSLAERPGKIHIKHTGIFGGGMADIMPSGALKCGKTPDDDAWLFFKSLYAVGKGGYCGIVRLHVSGGYTRVHGSRVKIYDADEALIIARVVPFDDDSLFSPSQDISELSEITADYRKLLEEHAGIHGELFGRLRLDLSAAADSDATQSNEELMEQARAGIISPLFVERMHDFGRYLLISSSGHLPPNLQGVWNGTWNPPWSSDYTLDENLQMMMWQVLPGNMPELAQSYFNLIESYIGDWKTNAKLFYGCRGVLSSLRSSTDGLHKHFCQDYPMMFWTAGAGWLAQMFYDYWQFTGDDAFLKDHVIPYLKEIALFYEDFLVTDRNGKFEFIPSYSPENTPSNSDNPVAINATMDIAVAKEVLSNLISACELLGEEGGNIPKWKAMLEKMPDYMVNSDGALKEWSHPAFEDDYHHRHSSHLYPVFPGFEVTREDTPELYAACLRAAELRLTDGIEAITGWGLAHLANISARLKDGELGFKALSRIMSKFLLPNLFTCHNEGELFQMDANLGFSAALLEMLVFSGRGCIELLPALPARLRKGSVSGVLCRGCITLAELVWDMDGKYISAVLRSGTDRTVRVRLPGVITSYKVISGSDCEIAEKERCEAGTDQDGCVCGPSDVRTAASELTLRLKKDIETKLIAALE